jgi:hypothetical protein
MLRQRMVHKVKVSGNVTLNPFLLLYRFGLSGYESSGDGDGMVADPPSMGFYVLSIDSAICKYRMIHLSTVYSL